VAGDLLIVSGAPRWVDYSSENGRVLLFVQVSNNISACFRNCSRFHCNLTRAVECEVSLCS
jgi:hypothetical protein